MATYLRTTGRGTWHPPEEYGDIEEGDIPADPLGDLRTTRNKLSVWRIENDEGDEEESRSNLNRIAVAIAATRTEPSDIHYILISSGTLEGLGFSVEPSDGGTPDREANQWHYDVVGLSAKKLLKLVYALFGSVDPKVVLKPTVEEHLRAALKGGQIRKLGTKMLVKLGIVEPQTCPNCGTKIEF